MKVKSEIENIIIENVKKIPEVPLSFLLSGGLDSSFVLALIKEAYPDLPIATFTLAKTNKHPDLVNAREVAKLFGTIHTEIVPSDKDVEEFLKEFNKIRKSDFKGDINWYILFSHARSFSDIIVTGDGGDECFGGYWLHRYPLGHKENGGIKSFEEIHVKPKNHLERMVKLGFRDFYFKEKSKPEDFNSVWEYYVAMLTPEHINIISYISSHFGVQVYSPLCSDELISFMRDLPYTDKIDKKLERELALKYLPKPIVYRGKLALNVALEL